MIRILMVVAVSMAVSGCAPSKTLTQLRSSPGETYTSSTPVDAVTRCMRALPTDMLEVTTYPGSDTVEFMIGSPRDMVYLAMATKNGAGSDIAIHTYGRTLWAMPESEFRASVKRCAPER